jgi:hypothetical protein
MADKPKPQRQIPTKLKTLEGGLLPAAEADANVLYCFVDHNGYKRYAYPTSAPRWLFVKAIDVPNSKEVIEFNTTLKAKREKARAEAHEKDKAKNAEKRKKIKIARLKEKEQETKAELAKLED